MKPNLQNTQALITRELIKLGPYIYKSLQVSEKPLLNQFTEYLLKYTGKQLRAQLVFLVAGAHGKITAETKRAAALVTLLHNASLIHDDVVDGAIYRRGISSMNAVWSNKEAVLWGDYLLSSSITMAMKHRDYTLLSVIAKTAQAMSEGELLQLEKAKELAMQEAIYFEIIHKKTASLIAACCSIGALSAHSSMQQVKRMHKIGEQLGMAFQIQDDLLDYGLQAELDEATGMDIKEKKITLPLLYALAQAQEGTRQAMMTMIKDYNHEPAILQEVIAWVHTQGGIAYAQKIMYSYKERALELGRSYLPESTYKELLLRLIDSTIS